MSGPIRIAISQRFLPHYRLIFFDELNRALAEQGCRLRLFYSYTLGQIDHKPEWACRLFALKIDLQLADLADSAVFTPTLFWRLVRYHPDVVVLEDIGGLLNGLTGALYCRLWKKPYLIWGLGNVPQKRRSRLRKILGPLIQFLYRGAFGFVCYSNYAAEIYGASEKPTYVAPNSSLAKPSLAEITAVEDAIRSRYNGDALRLLSIGALKAQKRFDILLHAMATVSHSVTLDLVGDGPEMPALKRLADSLGIAERVRFHGALYEQNKKLDLLLSAHLGVMPGRGGLAIQEMMRYGVPAISGVADGTEKDLILDGGSGYLADGFLSAPQIAEAVAKFARLTAEQQAAMARSALEVVVQTSNVGTMVRGFTTAISDALAGTHAARDSRCLE